MWNPHPHFTLITPIFWAVDKAYYLEHLVFLQPAHPGLGMGTTFFNYFAISF